MTPRAAWTTARLDLRRRRLLRRARIDALTPLIDRTAAIRPGDVLLFACIRDDAPHLPGWLDHHRALGVRHVLAVDNGSTDGTAAILASAPDVSLWTTRAGYRAARFGMDWLNALLARYGTGHWCLTLDADERLAYPDQDRDDLSALTAKLDVQGQRAMGALMIDLYPDGPADGAPGDPLDRPAFLDPDGYAWRRHPILWSLTAQGGPRRRVLFAGNPDAAPHLTKLPLVRWERGTCYLGGAHTILPRRLSLDYDGPRGRHLSGALLHLKLMGDAAAKAADPAHRIEMRTDPARYAASYDRLSDAPDFRDPRSVSYEGWRQLERLGMMGRGEGGNPS